MSAYWTDESFTEEEIEVSEDSNCTSISDYQPEEAEEIEKPDYHKSGYTFGGNIIFKGV